MRVHAQEMRRLLRYRFIRELDRVPLAKRAQVFPLALEPISRSNSYGRRRWRLIYDRTLRTRLLMDSRKSPIVGIGFFARFAVGHLAQ